MNRSILSPTQRSFFNGMPSSGRGRRALASLCALILLCLLTAGLSGCGKLLDPGPPPTRIQLSPAMPGKVGGKALDKQLVVALPLAGRDIDTDGIALVFNGREVRYLAGMRWTSAVPQLVQRNLIDALEATGGLRGVADETAGISANAKLLCQIKQFSLHYADANSAPTATFTASFRILNLANGTVVATKVVDVSTGAGGKDDAALVRAAETVLGKALAEAAPWVVQEMRNIR